jgi:hypothetical protein
MKPGSRLPSTKRGFRIQDYILTDTKKGVWVFWAAPSPSQPALQVTGPVPPPTKPTNPWVKQRSNMPPATDPQSHAPYFKVPHAQVHGRKRAPRQVPRQPCLQPYQLGVHLASSQALYLNWGLNAHSHRPKQSTAWLDGNRRRACPHQNCKVQLAVGRVSRTRVIRTPLLQTGCHPPSALTPYAQTAPPACSACERRGNLPKPPAPCSRCRRGPLPPEPPTWARYVQVPLRLLVSMINPQSTGLPLRVSPEALALLWQWLQVR